METNKQQNPTKIQGVNYKGLAQHAYEVFSSFIYSLHSLVIELSCTFHAFQMPS